VRRRTAFIILLAYLLTSGLYLLTPGEEAWAVPGQNPNRQSSPTRTPTPGATPSPGRATPPAEAPAPVSPPVRFPLPLPAETLTPLFRTLFPPTATPRATWVEVPDQTESAQGGILSTRSPSPTPLDIVQPTLASTRASELGEMMRTPTSSQYLQSTLRGSDIVDLVVLGIGLILLLAGLVLVGRRRAT
jgi:hypothetical protein